MDRIYDVITFILESLYLRKPTVAIFADIIKIVTTFSKTILKDSKKSRWLKLCIKMQFMFVFLDIAKFADFR